MAAGADLTHGTIDGQGDGTDAMYIGIVLIGPGRQQLLADPDVGRMD